MVKFSKTDYKRLEEIAGRQQAVVKPFENDTPEKRLGRCRKVKKDGWSAFEFFAKQYFPHVVHLEFSSAHRYMFQVIEGRTGLICVTGFRGLGKTAIFGLLYPLWKIVKGEKYLVYVCADIAQSSEKAGFLRYELETNARLLGDFPELKIAEDDEESFFLANNTKIRPASIKQSIRGTINPKTARRPGLIILDDIDSEINLGNPLIGKRRKDKITQEIRGSLDPQSQGRAIWLGNITHPNFAIAQFKSQILEEIKADRKTVNEYSTCLIGNEKCLLQIPVEKGGKSMWEEQYPTDSLPALKAEYGAVGYLREMMGRALIDGLIFKAEWFIAGKIPSDKAMTEVWLYVDPAWGQKGCYKSVISIGYDGYNYYVLKVWVRQCENSKLFEYLHRVHQELTKRFSVRYRASFESNFGQDRMLLDFDSWAREKGLNPIGHFFRKINNRENKNLRIEQLEPVIESGAVVFPEGQDMPTLIGQFTAYPKGYIDGCDAFAGCMERFTRYSKARRVRVRSRFTL